MMSEDRSLGVQARPCEGARQRRARTQPRSPARLRPVPPTLTHTLTQLDRPIISSPPRQGGRPRQGTGMTYACLTKQVLSAGIC